MLLRQLLTDRYAPVRGLCARSIVIYSHTIDRFRDFLGREPTVADLEEDLISSFVTWRRRTIHSERRGLPRPATVRKDRDQLLALAKYAFHKRLIHEFPEVKSVRGAKQLPRGFKSEEVGKMIVAARKRKRTLAGLPAGWWWSTLIYAAWCSGARRGELLKLKWKEVRGCELIFLADTRKGNTRDIARQITPDLAAELELHRRGPDDLVWPWPHLETSLYSSMKILCDQAGVPQRRFHAIRKASASYVQAAGGDAVSHLDHSDANITRDHYLDDRIVGKAAGVDFLPALDLAEEAEFIEDHEPVSD